MPTKTLINVVFVLMIMLLICFPNSASAFPSFKSIPLPSLGSEALAFDSHGNVYTGLNDGRIVKSSTKDAKHVFEEFATTVRIRSRKLCDATNGNMPTGGAHCGRPLDLEFDTKTGWLYIVDLYRGLMVVGPEGGVATRVSKRDGMPNNAPDAIAIDPITNDVYFTLIGNIIFTNNNMSQVLQSGDRSGKLLKYDPKTRKISVVLTGLAGPAGAVVSEDGSFILIAEYLACNITRLWLKGPKANTTETFAQLPGNPDNMKRTKAGDFWVAVNIQKLYPKLISFPLGQKLNAKGKIKETVNFYAEYNSTYITEVHEHRGSLYVASIYARSVGVYKEGRNC